MEDDIIVAAVAKVDADVLVRRHGHVDQLKAVNCFSGMAVILFMQHHEYGMPKILE